MFNSMPMLCNFFLSWNCEMTSLHLSKRYVLALSVSFHSFCTSPSPKLPTLIIVSNSPALPYLTGRTTEAPTVSCVCPLCVSIGLMTRLVFITLLRSSLSNVCIRFLKLSSEPARADKRQQDMTERSKVILQFEHNGKPLRIPSPCLL
ncbi:hypothetical protein AAZX31_13G295500 [Glycine max]|nr:hypothetical protein GLYMA_13G313901v4 [Glycine max]KAH1104298.1 hypothetical protein GYH30_037953 [Glycine max]